MKCPVSGLNPNSLVGAFFRLKVVHSLTVQFHKAFLQREVSVGHAIGGHAHNGRCCGGSHGRSAHSRFSNPGGRISELQQERNLLHLLPKEKNTEAPAAKKYGDEGRKSASISLSLSNSSALGVSTSRRVQDYNSSYIPRSNTQSADMRYSLNARARSREEARDTQHARDISRDLRTRDISRDLNLNRRENIERSLILSQELALIAIRLALQNIRMNLQLNINSNGAFEVDWRVIDRILKNATKDAVDLDSARDLEIGLDHETMAFLQNLFEALLQRTSSGPVMTVAILMTAHDHVLEKYSEFIIELFAKVSSLYSNSNFVEYIIDYLDSDSRFYRKIEEHIAMNTSYCVVIGREEVSNGSILLKKLPKDEKHFVIQDALSPESFCKRISISEFEKYLQSHRQQ